MIQNLILVLLLTQIVCFFLVKSGISTFLTISIITINQLIKSEIVFIKFFLKSSTRLYKKICKILKRKRHSTKKSISKNIINIRDYKNKNFKYSK